MRKLIIMLVIFNLLIGFFSINCFADQQKDVFKSFELLRTNSKNAYFNNRSYFKTLLAEAKAELIILSHIVESKDPILLKLIESYKYFESFYDELLIADLKQKSNLISSSLNSRSMYELPDIRFNKSSYDAAKKELQKAKKALDEAYQYFK